MKRFAIIALLLVVPAVAQIEHHESSTTNSSEVAEMLLPSAPSAMAADPVLPVLPSTAKSPILAETSTHAFLDRPAKIRFAILAGLIAADGITTQHVLNADGGKEVNPLARPFVTHGAPGQLAASTLGYAFGIGGSYLFHRTGHHMLERMFQKVSIGVEAECVTNNLIQSALTNRSGR